MGRIKQGLNSGLSGKTGNVIGSSWKEADYIKDRSKISINPQTQSQFQQQLRFILAGTISQAD